MRKIFTKRRLRYGSVAAALTVLVTVIIMLLNIALSALSGAYGWYIDMRESLIWSISENTHEYLGEKIFPQLDGDKIEIILCGDKNTLKNTAASRYVLETISELEETYPDKIYVTSLNIWENPKLAREYGISSESDVVFKYRDRHSTLALSHFYITTNENTETPSAYNGERRIASAMLRVVSDSTPTCYFTVNHGESTDGSALTSLLADMGYNFGFLDLSKQSIPSDCDMLLTVNPAFDFYNVTADTKAPETNKLREYMSGGGKYFVFVSSDTFNAGGLENLEKFLSEWGVSFTHSAGDDGVEQTYTVKDPGNAVSVDGYTFFSDYSNNSTAEKIFSGTTKPCIFSGATTILPAEGFKSSSNGFVSGEKTMTPVISTHSSAQAYSGGYIADKANDTPFTLMSLTQAKCNNGKTAYLYACSSAYFCSESALQSIVYGNSEAFMRAVEYTGTKNIPSKLLARPLTAPPIQSLSTKDARIISVLLCVLPTLAIAATGIVILVRRRHS